MQRAGFTTLLGVVILEHQSWRNFLNLSRFFKRISANVQSFGKLDIRETSRLAIPRIFKITLRKNWRAVNVQESKSDGARPMKNASDEDGGRYTVAIRCVRSGLDMETDQGRRKETVEGPREWY